MTDGCRCSGWLEIVTREAEPVATPIRVRARTITCSQGGELTDFGIVYTREISVDVLQATGSMVSQIILCCFALLFYWLDIRANGESLSCLFSGSPSRLVRPVHCGHYTVTAYIMMAEGGRRSSDHSGVRFRNVLQTSWNAPESLVTLSSPEVVELDISVVPDVLGLRTCDSNAEVFRVLPGRARYSVCVLIPDDRVASPGFHDVTLVHQTSESGHIVSMDDMCDLRRQWPSILLLGMSKFRSKQAGLCKACGTNIQHDMALHVSTYHLDLGQLWRCPVSWCTQWKGTPQDCIDHIRARHHMGDSVKTANLRRWFPP